MDEMWSLETSKIVAKMRNINNLITTCESSGFNVQLTSIVPLRLKYVFGLSVDFSMLQHSLRPGRHSAVYRQFFTIRQERSGFIHLYGVSKEAVHDRYVMPLGYEPRLCVSKLLTITYW